MSFRGMKEFALKPGDSSVLALQIQASVTSQALKEGSGGDGDMGDVGHLTALVVTWDVLSVCFV